MDATLEYVTSLAQEASKEMGVEFLSVVKSPYAGPYYVVTFWWKNKPYSATVHFYSGDDYRRWSIDCMKQPMLGAMVNIGEQVHELLTFIRAKNRD